MNRIWGYEASNGTEEVEWTNDQYQEHSHDEHTLGTFVNGLCH